MYGHAGLLLPENALKGLLGDDMLRTACTSPRTRDRPHAGSWGAWRMHALKGVLIHDDGIADALRSLLHAASFTR